MNIAKTERLITTRSCPLATVCFAVALAIGGCTGDAPAGDANEGAHILPFDTAVVRVVTASDTIRLTLELAESEPQKTLGLMERSSLAPDAGMLFLYPTTQPATAAFWMYRTRIPLDIAFIDSAGTIRTIQTMQPCASALMQGCPDYAAGAPYRAALEVNAGFFARHRVRAGDRVLLADTVVRRRAGESRSIGRRAKVRVPETLDKNAISLRVGSEHEHV